MAVDLPPPAPTPPSIEEAVQSHLDVVHELREFRAELTEVKKELGGIKAELGLFRDVVARAVNVATEARLLMGRLSKHLGLPDV